MKTKKWWLFSLVCALLLLAAVPLANVGTASAATGATSSNSPTYAEFVFMLEGPDEYCVGAADYSIKYAAIPDEYMGKPVTTIMDYGFAFCEDLEEIYLPPSIKTIGSGAFMGCDKLSVGNLIDVVSVNDYAFSYCTTLETVVLNENIEYVDPYAFMSSSPTIYTAQSQQEANWSSFLEFFDGEFRFSHDGMTCSTVWENGITGGTAIGYSLVNFGTAAAEINISGNENFAIEDYNGDHGFLPIVSIESYAFRFANLNSLTVGQLNPTGPDINIKSHGFASSKIKYIWLSNRVTFNQNATSQSTAVFLMSTAQLIYLPDNMTEIPSSMFQGCAQLQTIQFVSYSNVNTLPSTIKHIGKQAFAGCTNLTKNNSVSISISSNIETIGQNAFASNQTIYIDLYKQQVDALVASGDWHAQWNGGSATISYKKVTYSIAYNSNGGSGSISSQTNIEQNADIVLKTATGFSRTGYFVQSWQTSNGTFVSGVGTSTAGTSYNLGGTYSNLSEENGETVTLFAVWKPINYTVVYNSNGGSGTTASSVHTYDVAKKLTSEGFTRSGYRFMGWSTSSSGSVVYANSANVLNLSSTNGATINLYAKWEQEYTISYQGNGIGYSGYTGEPWTYIGMSFTNFSDYVIKTQNWTPAHIEQRGYKIVWAEYQGSTRTGVIYEPGKTYTGIARNMTLKAEKRETTLYESQDIYTLNQLKLLQTFDFASYPNMSFGIYGNFTVDNWTPIPEFRGYLTSGQLTPSSGTSKITITSFSSGTYTNIGFIGVNYGIISNIAVEANIDVRDRGSNCNVGIIIGYNKESSYFLSSSYAYGSITCYDDQQYGQNIFKDKPTGAMGLVGKCDGIGEAQVGRVMSNCVNYASISAAGRPSGGGECVATGTLITLADGTQKAVELLTGEELLLVWNMHTGTFDTAPILFIDSDPAKFYEVISLYFSDGTVVKVIDEHAFWDFDLNMYIFLDSGASQYIGHWFNKQITDENGYLDWIRVQLVNVVVQDEYTSAWSPVTFSYLCYYVNGMLSMPGATQGLINIFEVDDELMQYDQTNFFADIETYGLFTYEEFAEIFPIPELVFEAFGGQYLKVSIGKGLIDIETLELLIDSYAEFFGIE